MSPASPVSPLIAALLGVLQGLTEFLPVSSSGHLVIAQALLRAPAAGITLEIVLHAGTLLAVGLAYRRDLGRIAADAWGALRALPREGTASLGRARELGWLILATIPAALVGFLLGDRIEAVFERPRTTALLIAVTGLLLLAAHARRGATGPLTTGRALAMGLFQAVSLLPGISRCGSTLAGGILCGGRPEAMVRFSFLMSIPAILGTVVVRVRQLAAITEGGSGFAYAIGFVAACLCGLAAIRLLVRAVAQRRLVLFAIYCLIVGVAGGLWLPAR